MLLYLHGEVFVICSYFCLSFFFLSFFSFFVYLFTSIYLLRFRISVITRLVLGLNIEGKEGNVLFNDALNT